ncbi:MAG: stage 0 sporulation family protein [Chloroflexi bacterium]|nr:stage 0 sporulation family protein [Chloroflexota bacterium]
MVKVVGVAFRPAGKIYFFDPQEYELKEGDYVIVETSRGREMGTVVFPPHEVEAKHVPEPLKPVIRPATAWDLASKDLWAHREAEAKEICKAKIKEHGLKMKLVKCEYNYDGSQLIVYFTAEKRVDFRALVRDLAKTFHTRIEMRQIGDRDEAKMLSGYGRCGRELCCASWMRDFNPVSIKMAKLQSLPLNPSEITGVCGKLLCCLAYELRTYEEAKEKLPRVGSVVMTTYGRGKVLRVNVLKETVLVRLIREDGEEGDLVELGPDMIYMDNKEKPPANCEGCPHRAVTNKA